MKDSETTNDLEKKQAEHCAKHGQSWLGPQTTQDENEYITVTIVYGKHDPFERLECSTSWKRVPEQNQVWEKTKKLIDNLYNQVR